ncbi:MAG: hypothetical protein R2825_02075 [Saprospiraceae bacterium]
MMAAVNKTAWDTTTLCSGLPPMAATNISGTKRNLVKINFGENEVLLNTKKWTGKSFSKIKEITVTLPTN